MRQDYGYQQDRGYQTPPGTRRELNHASVLRRIGAYIIDGLLIGAINGLIIMAGLFTGFMTLPDTTDPTTSMTGIYFSTFYLLSILLSILITLGYFTYFESRSGGGATLAKRLLSLQVVNEHGRNVSGTKSFIRNIARLLWNLPCIGFVILIIDVILVATNDQRIGDKLAGTYVVEEENGSIYKYTRQGPGPQGFQDQGQYQRPQGRPRRPSQQQQTRQPPQRSSQQPPQKPSQQQPSRPPQRSSQQPSQHKPSQPSQGPPKPRSQQRSQQSPRAGQRTSQSSPRPPQQGEKACPDCGKSMKYIEKAQQWYCYSCGEYK